MVNLTLKSNDSIDTVLPSIELAMHTGDVCSIHNINYLSHIHMAALTLLAKSESLMDPETGEVFHPHPGFRLQSIDDHGVTRTLVR